MLLFTWFFIYIILTRSAAQERLTISRADNTNKANSTLKHAVPTVKHFTLKVRNMKKLTFQTLYPTFMLNWTTIKLNGKKPVTKVLIENSTRNITPGRKSKKIDDSMIRRSNAMHNAFIDVVTMTPYVPKRIMSSKTISKNRSTESRNQRSSSNYLKSNKGLRHLLPSSSRTQKNLNTKFLTTSDLFKNILKQNRFLLADITKSPSQSKLSRNTKTAKNDISMSFGANEQALNRLRRLENDLRKIRNSAKNGTDIINRLKTKVQEQENEYAEMKIKSRRNSFSGITSAKSTMTIAEDIGGKKKQGMNYRRNYKRTTPGKNLEERKGIKMDFSRLKNSEEYDYDIKLNDSTRKHIKKHYSNNKSLELENVHKLTKDPLHYDSFDMEIEFESNMREIFDVQDKKQTVAVKPNSFRKAFENNHFDTKSNKNITTPTSNILNHKRRGAKIRNKELYSFNHLKFVDNVMQKSLPLNEQRNIIMQSIDGRMSELYKRNNLRPKEFQDNLDDAMKAVGATLHK